MRKEILVVDGVVNLVLGILLMWYPLPVAARFGLPAEATPFFASILGAVLFGVGVALFVECFRPPLRAIGLGLGGAISINMCGGLVLAGWLLGGRLNLTMLGQTMLWGLVLVLVGLSTVELYFHRGHA